MQTNTRVAIKGFDGQPVIPHTANTIFISPIKDVTNTYGLNQILIERLKQEVLLNRRLMISSSDTADMVVSCTITDYAVQNIEYGPLRRPVKKRVRVIVTVHLYENKSKKLIFYESGLQAFYIFSDVIPPLVQESEAQLKVIEQLAKRLRSKIISGWYTEHLSKIEKGKQ